MKLGLVGWDVSSGLGQYNRDLAHFLGVTKWLVPQHPHYPASQRPSFETCIRTSLEPDRETLRAFLDGLDWLIFAETPYIAELPELASKFRVRIAMIPMLEAFEPRSPWVPLVDLMLPPTQECEAVLNSTKKEFGFKWRVVRVAGAVDTDRFVFRQRGVCERFLFCNGHGGCAGRKGASCVARAARLVPEIPILFHSQTNGLTQERRSQASDRVARAALR